MSGIAPETVRAWRKATGRQRTQRQRLEEGALRRYALAVGCDDEAALPPLPHWAFFVPDPPDIDLGPDGHPKKGGFVPDIALPRRMFAASEMTFERPLDIGAQAELSSTIIDVTHKSGRSGDLVFVDVERVLSQRSEERVRERQTYVYRGQGTSGQLSLPCPADKAPDGEVWQPSEVNLFRFSAATFNAHRIHYDLPYARDVEGYPALVVHGSFTAARLAALAERKGPLASFAFRAKAPLFLGQPVYLRRLSETEVEAVRCDGMTAMAATVGYR